jgi:hypothetical protein
LPSTTLAVASERLLAEYSTRNAWLPGRMRRNPRFRVRRASLVTTALLVGNDLQAW